MGQGGRQTLMEISGEAYLLDRDAEWLISSLATEVNGQGAVTHETRMREILGCLRNAAAQIPYPDLVLEAAYEMHDDKLCVPRQLAILLGRPLRELCESFDDLLGTDSWRSAGLAAETLKKWCVLRGHPLFFVSGGS